MSPYIKSTSICIFLYCDHTHTTHCILYWEYYVIQYVTMPWYAISAGPLCIPCIELTYVSACDSSVCQESGNIESVSAALLVGIGVGALPSVHQIPQLHYIFSRWAFKYQQWSICRDVWLGNITHRLFFQSK